MHEAGKTSTSCSDSDDKANASTPRFDRSRPSAEEKEQEGEVLVKNASKRESRSRIDTELVGGVRVPGQTQEDDHVDTQDGDQEVPARTQELYDEVSSEEEDNTPIGRDANGEDDNVDPHGTHQDKANQGRTSGPRSEVNSIKGRGAQLQAAVLNHTEKKAKSAIAKIFRYVAKHKQNFSRPIHVVFSRESSRIILKLNQNRVKKRDLNYNPGRIWDAIKVLISSKNIHETTTVLNGALDTSDCNFTVLNLKTYEASENNLVGTFEMHINDESTPKQSDSAARKFDRRRKVQEIPSNKPKRHRRGFNSSQYSRSPKRRHQNVGARKTSSNLSAQTPVPGVSSSTHRGDGTTSTIRSECGSTSSSSRGGVDAMDTNTPDTASSDIFQSSTAEEEAARRRFEFLFKISPNDVKLQLLKESFANVKKF